LRDTCFDEELEATFYGSPDDYIVRSFSQDDILDPSLIDSLAVDSLMELIFDDLEGDLLENTLLDDIFPDNMDIDNAAAADSAIRPLIGLGPGFLFSPLHSQLAIAQDADTTASLMGPVSGTCPIIGNGPSFLFSPIHSTFLDRHPSFASDRIPGSDGDELVAALADLSIGS
jgi:hypothetical protein